jgi:hypothetical protein
MSVRSATRPTPPHPPRASVDQGRRPAPPPHRGPPRDGPTTAPHPRLRHLADSRQPQRLQADRVDRPARDADLPHLHSFCNGLEIDRAAVNAGLALPWSNGPTEGSTHTPNGSCGKCRAEPDSNSTAAASCSTHKHATPPPTTEQSRSFDSPAPGRRIWFLRSSVHSRPRPVPFPVRAPGGDVHRAQRDIRRAGGRPLAQFIQRRERSTASMLVRAESKPAASMAYPSLGPPWLTMQNST